METLKALFKITAYFCIICGLSSQIVAISYYDRVYAIPINTMYSDSSSFNVTFNYTIVPKKIEISGIVSRFGNASVFYHSDPYLVLMFEYLENSSVDCPETPQYAVFSSNSTDPVNKSSEYGASIQYAVQISERKDSIILEMNLDSVTVNSSEETLCTLWDIETALHSDALCFGAEDCCSFVGMQASRPVWNESLFYPILLDELQSELKASARVITLLPMPSSDIINYSLSVLDPISITIPFCPYAAPFAAACDEGCFESWDNESAMQLSIQLANSSIYIDSVTIIQAVAVNHEPIFMNNISDISLPEHERYMLNLSNHFVDEDGDTMAYSIYDKSGLDIQVKGSIATISGIENVDGNAYLYVSASDGQYSAFSNVFKISLMEKKTFGLRSLRLLIGLG